ncbi:hypothetical protein, partial [Ferviditalea candida]|nr:hypothetical protein [Paenibacillaceae bacterium T2]
MVRPEHRLGRGAVRERHPGDVAVVVVLEPVLVALGVLEAQSPAAGVPHVFHALAVDGLRAQIAVVVIF